MRAAGIRGGGANQGKFGRVSGRPFSLWKGSPSDQNEHTDKLVTIFGMSLDVNMKVIQRYLGHSNMSTTADIYSHLDANATGEAGMKLGKLLADDEEVNWGAEGRRNLLGAAL